MVALQLPVAIGFRFERTRFPSEIRKPAFEYPNNQRVPLIPSDCHASWPYSVVLRFTGKCNNKNVLQFTLQIVKSEEHSQQRRRVRTYKICSFQMLFAGLSPSTATANLPSIQSTEFNGLSETLVLIPPGSFSRFIGAVSKHLKPYQHFSRAQAEHARLSSSFVLDELAISAWLVCWDRLFDAGRAASSSKLSHQIDALPNKPLLSTHSDTIGSHKSSVPNTQMNCHTIRNHPIDCLSFDSVAYLNVI